MGFDQWLAANGYDVEQLKKPENAKQLKHLEAAWKAEHPPTPEPDKKPDKPTSNESFDQKMKAIEAEAERQQHIRDQTARAAANYKHDPDKFKQLRELCDSAIEDTKVDARAYDLSLMRFDRATSPFVLAPKQDAVTDDVVEAAICIGQSLPNIEKRFSEQVLNAADKRFGRGMGLRDLLVLAAKQNGYRGHFAKGNLEAIWRAAMARQHEDLMASVGPSNINVAGILSNVANKTIVDAFDFVEQEWRAIATIENVNDFKEHTSYSLTGNLIYTKVPPGGELEHGTVGELPYTIQIDTYGKILGIDRRDIINDDLGAFTRIARKLGRGGALALNKVVWTEFLADHATFFPTDNSNGNYEAGSDDSLLDLVGLATANTKFELQTDPDGNPVGISPAIVLVPPQLYPQAFTLLKSDQLNMATSTAATTGTKSPWMGMFKLVKSKYLAMAAMGGGYSAAAWYLLADPNDVPTITVAFLEGQQTPTVRSGDFEMDRLGMIWQAYHDFGSNKAEYRAAVKMKGSA